MTNKHDNYLSFKKTGITKATYNIKAYDITDGQPHGGVDTSSDSNGITLDFHAGRKGDPGNASWFFDHAKGGNAIATEDFDSWPASLNFTTMGTLVFTYNNKLITVEDLIIGQGHSARDRNNWWIASPKAKQIVGSNPLVQVLTIPAMVGDKIKTPAEIKFQTVIGDVSHFDMEILNL